MAVAIALTFAYGHLATPARPGWTSPCWAGWAAATVRDLVLLGPVGMALMSALLPWMVVPLVTTVLDLSLFSGEPWRATSFLHSQGVPVLRPARPAEDAARRAATSMPAYPTPSWAAVVDGVLVVRLK